VLHPEVRRARAGEPDQLPLELNGHVRDGSN
jgi:hypothetical protein